MSQDSRDILYAFAGLGFGVWSFFWGFTRLRRKRLIENTPTSTIRSAPMGLVEVVGKATRAKTLISPIEKKTCILYRYTVERYQSNGKNSSWVQVAKGDSYNCPFEIEDKTGRITVVPKMCELITDKDYEFTSGIGRGLTQEMINFLEEHNIKYHAFLGNYQMRLREWIIEPGDNVYVLGVAQKDGNFLNDHQAKVYRRLEELKSQPGAVDEADLDKDGTISQEEWGLFTKRIEQKVLEEEIACGQQPINDVVIGKSGKEVFILSDKSQKDLTKALAWQAFGGIWGGAILATAMLAYLIWRFSIGV